MYVDNELSASERAEVEAFVNENPDLKTELDMFREVVLRPEPELMFDNKQSLLKGNTDNPVNELNYEEYFVMYADDELTIEEKRFTEEFVYKHPRFQQEFELILEAKLVADKSIIFSDKKSLYRTEKERRVVYIRWQRIAAAAIVTGLMLVSAWYFLGNNNTNQNGPVVAQNNETKSNNKANKQTAPAPDKSASTNSESVQRQAPADIVEEQTPASPVKELRKPNTSEKKSDKPRNISPVENVTPEKTEIAMNEEPHAPIEKIKPSEIETGLIASNERKPIIDEAISESELRMRASGNTVTTDVIDAAAETDNNIVYVANTSVSKKNKMRGIFRKASRFVEKATNFDPTGKDGDGIRIANFEIALK
jgi:hypothetical protein